MHAKKGEIGVLLTIISLITIVIGAFIGTRTNVTRFLPKAEEAKCPYGYTASIFEEGKLGDDALITSEENGGQPFSIDNDKGGGHETIMTGRVDRSDLDGIKPYIEGDHATVTLSGLDKKWTVVSTFCWNGGYPKAACPTITDQKSLAFKDFTPHCDSHPNYGWILKSTEETPSPTPIPPTTAPSASPRPSATTIPSPAPSARALCNYNSEAVVIKESDKQVLTKTENGLKDANGSYLPWGVSNGKQNQTIPAGSFGTRFYNGVKSSYSPNLAVYNYHNDDHVFGLPGEYKDGEYATVKLIGLGPDWEIVDSICDDKGSTQGATPCASYDQSTANPEVLSNIKLSCGINMRYGWVVRKKGTTTTPVPSSSPVPTQTTTQPVLNCSDIVSAGTDRDDIREWEMGKHEGDFLLSYDMYGVADRLKIEYEGKEIWHTPDFNLPFAFVRGLLANKKIHFGSPTSNSTKIKISLTANTTDHTSWYYTLSCPLSTPQPNAPKCTQTTGSLGGKLELDSETQKACNENGGCSFKVYDTGNTDNKVQTLENGNLTYSFENITTSEEHQISMRSFATTGNGLNEINIYAVPYNCFDPRRISSENSCTLLLSSEGSCQVSNVNFKVYFSKLFPTIVSYDFNQDGIINSLDGAIMVRNYGRKGMHIVGDVNYDLVINSLDRSLIISSFGKKIPKNTVIPPTDK